MDEAWLSTVRLARDIGDISSLFPPGVERLTDLPYTIHNAILNALVFLSFRELPEHEQPPRKFWLDEKKMEKWWASVKKQRKAEAKGEERPDNMAQNALTKKLLVGFD